MEREKFDFSNFSSFIKDGKVQDISELEEHLKKVDKENISYKGKLQIGDKVKLKRLDYTVIIKYINYEIPGIGIVDYAGKKIGEKQENLCLFNQKDIEYKITKEKNNNDEELEI